MRKFIVRLATKLAEKYTFASTLLNRIWCLYWAMNFKNVYSDRTLCYDSFSTDIAKEPPVLNDDRTNFMIRVLLENKYQRIVEIGAYNLMRPFHYKRLFPEIEVIGLDKISGFDDAKEINGIKTERFDFDWFETNKGPKTLVMSVDTLPYFEPDELRNFFEVLYRQGYDVSLSELGSHFAKTSSLRRSVTSYFHPYVHLLRKVGFSVNVIHTLHAFSLSAMERREDILATTDK